MTENKQKCSKCGTNDAKYDEVSITNAETKEKKIIYSAPICELCSEKLLKCSECKINQAVTITTKDNSEIILCGECCAKIQ